MKKVVVKTDELNITISLNTAAENLNINTNQEEKELEQKEKELEKEIREREENLNLLLIDYAGNEDDIRHIIEEAEYKIKKLKKELEEIKRIKETKYKNNNTNISFSLESFPTYNNPNGKLSREKQLVKK